MNIPYFDKIFINFGEIFITGSTRSAASEAAIDENFIKMTIFLFQWWVCCVNSKFWSMFYDYPQTSNISCTLVDNKIVDHSDVVGAAQTTDAVAASTGSAAPTTSSFLT